jgi:SAM-dependent methyltransferase
MASTCPVDLDTLRLRAEIESIYRRVATEPSGDFHFHRGPTYATEMLGYDAVALARLPVDSTASFAGVANPHRIAPMTAGATVVDIGCGAGMDLLLAAEAVGPGGRAIGVDMTEAMAERARAGARSRALANVEVRLGDAMSLPIESESVDVVISNGVLNLTPDKEQAFGEVDSPQYRSVDRLNRRRSAGGRACRASRASWLQRCRRKGALRLFSRDLEGRRGQEIRGRRRKCLRPQAALTLTL